MKNSSRFQFDPCLNCIPGRPDNSALINRSNHIMVQNYPCGECSKETNRSIVLHDSPYVQDFGVKEGLSCAPWRGNVPSNVHV